MYTVVNKGTVQFRSQKCTALQCSAVQCRYVQVLIPLATHLLIMV